MIRIIQDDDGMYEDFKDRGSVQDAGQKPGRSRNDNFKNNRSPKDQSQHTMSFAAVQTLRGFPGNSENSNRPRSNRGSNSELDEPGSGTRF